MGAQREHTRPAGATELRSTIRRPPHLTLTLSQAVTAADSDLVVRAASSIDARRKVLDGDSHCRTGSLASSKVGQRVRSFPLELEVAPCVRRG